MPEANRSLGDLRDLAWPLYVAGFLMLALPLGDLASNVWPPRMGQVEWRFGTLGLMAGFLLTPVLGVFMIAASAALLEHRVVQRVLAILNITAAVLMIGLTVIFALDWLQFRATIPPEGQGTMDLGSAKALAKDAVVALVLLWLGIVGWRISRRHGPAHGRHSAPPLIRDSGHSPA